MQISERNLLQAFDVEETERQTYPTPPWPPGKYLHVHN